MARHIKALALRFLIALAGLAALLSGPAFASAAPCTTVPRIGWVSVEEVEGHLRREGYTLLRLRVSNEACYLALVANAQGERREFRVHPVNGTLLGPVQGP